MLFVNITFTFISSKVSINKKALLYDNDINNSLYGKGVISSL